MAGFGQLRTRSRWAARGLCAGLLLALLGSSPACAGTAGRRDLSSWMEARGADLMDVFGLRIAAGVGLGVYARATEYVQLGVMYRGPAESRLVVSSETPHTEDFRVRGVPCVMAGTIGRYGGLWFENTREVMLPLYDNRDDPQSPIRREIVAGLVSLDGRGDDWRGSFGAGVHALLVGGEFEVRPWQAVDFLAGLIGYDPSGDDVPVIGEAEPEDSSN
jgi:hypothetical protein